MRNGILKSTLAILFAALVCLGDSLYTSTALGYSIYLPDNWTVAVSSDSQECFFDSTNEYSSYLSLIRYHRNPADFATATEWTRAFFIAYKVTAEFGYDPWGAVLYYDSLPTTKMGSLWAPEAYTLFYSLDTTWGAWAEYQRFTAAGDYGYSLYAAGDTTDMATNIGLYAAILATIDVPGGATAVSPRSLSGGRLMPARTTFTQDFMFDPLGRRITSVGGKSPRHAPAGIYISPSRGKSGLLH